MKEKDIDYALVESKRPPLYTAMKYWGKKPHNIWRNYILNYTPEDGIFLDPFAGSAMSAFEAFKCKRKAIAFDLNPLTSFIIEVFSSKYNEQLFVEAVNKLVKEVSEDELYKKFFTTNCRINDSNTIVHNFKWENGKIYELGVLNSDENSKNNRYVCKPNKEDIRLGKRINDIDLNLWYPTNKFHKSPSFSQNFLKKVGGNNFSNLWTKRNLYLLSKIFDKILRIKNNDLKKQLLFSFIQTLHLSSKMCVPRNPQSKRAFSTSWGRSAYICSNKQMEMNPLLLFKSSSLGKQSTQSAMNNMKSYLGSVPKTVCINNLNYDKNKDYDILYGIVDINNIKNFIDEESIDFILTDPPYGGLVQYADLSQVWLTWLQKYDPKYNFNSFDKEITIKRNIISHEDYTKKFTLALKNLHSLLKKDKKMVLTFHNKDLKIWNSFLKSIHNSSFIIEKVIHQQNRRTGESVVSNPYGTSANDFYIRCKKSTCKSVKKHDVDLEKFIIDTAIKTIVERNEPTSYQIIFNKILSEISSQKIDLENFDENISNILSKYEGEIFIIKYDDYEGLKGIHWWLNEKYLKKNKNEPLSSRIDKTVLNILKTKNKLTLDEIISIIFKKYPGALTPDIRIIEPIVKRHAKKYKNEWIYDG